MEQAFYIRLERLGKKFYQRWIFRDVEYDSLAHPRLAVIGRNGSGKSTLLRIIAGQMVPSEGRSLFYTGTRKVAADACYRYLSWSAPYLSLYEDLTLREHLDLHFRLRDCLLPRPADLIDLLALGDHADKRLRYYSSGMLQRVKVGTALFTAAPLLLLDEPTSNMDEENARRMIELIDTYRGDRVLVLASNLEREFAGFERRIVLGSG
ncbi:MAG: ABC transporter ATP-binding protein [Bacteroidia bacterium]